MMSAPEEIHKLIERFDRNFDTYRSGRYNEAQVRQEGKGRKREEEGKGVRS
ncbi:MAG: hypothetical protein U9P49_01785 [Thermodesulfobacteriota bacterium]|nr:hypothetical protein [Thermodesulfobacteriota bacterium]